MLQVAMGGEIISSSVVFEYKARDLPALPSSQHDWLSLDGESIWNIFYADWCCLINANLPQTFQTFG